MKYIPVILVFLISQGTAYAASQSTPVSSVRVDSNFSPEQQKIIDVAKKEAQRLGYDLRKYEIHLETNRKKSFVYFWAPNNDAGILTISVESATGKILSLSVCKPDTYYFDDEELVVVNAAKKEAIKLGFNPKKYEIYLDTLGRTSVVCFCLPKSDVSSLTIWVGSDTGKILSVQKTKRRPVFGYKGE